MEAKFKISEVLALKGATSMGDPNPISNGPISFPPPKTFISFVDIAALCNAGMIRMLALPTIFEKG